MEEGGWKPMIRKHGGVGSKHQRSKSGIHTVFVDNLLESMEPKGLYTLFTNFEVVQDIFIPYKRRKMTRSRALKVKAIEFVRRKEAQKRPLHLLTQRHEMRGVGQISWKIKGKESYAQVVSGKGFVASAHLIVKVYEVGNGWLYNSAIVRLKPLCCGADFQKELRTRGMEDIEF
ncbi:hypothetical protein ACSBR1_023521 [Camellia fascicularis]